MRRLLLIGALLSACDELGEPVSTQITLTVQNQVGAKITAFAQRSCGAAEWTDVMAVGEEVNHGDWVSSNPLPPGCYEIYIEDEAACWAEKNVGDINSGEFVWTVQESNLTC
jgi:hypothetical protein